MNYLVLLVIIFGCIILAVLLVIPLFRFSQMQSSDLHLLAEFKALAEENRRAILDLERRIDHTDAPPKGQDVPDVSDSVPTRQGETTIRGDRPS